MKRVCILNVTLKEANLSKIFDTVLKRKYDYEPKKKWEQPLRAPKKLFYSIVWKISFFSKSKINFIIFMHIYKF